MLLRKLPPLQCNLTGIGFGNPKFPTSSNSFFGYYTTIDFPLESLYLTDVSTPLKHVHTQWKIYTISFLVVLMPPLSSQTFSSNTRVTFISLLTLLTQPIGSVLAICFNISTLITPSHGTLYSHFVSGPFGKQGTQIYLIIILLSPPLPKLTWKLRSFHTSTIIFIPLLVFLSFSLRVPPPLPKRCF